MSDEMRDEAALERAGALSLAAGAIIYIALMVVHPSHAGPPVFFWLSLSGLVHGAALTMKPVLLFGFVVLSRRLGFTRPLVLPALCFYALSAVFTMLAGTMSGLIFPEMIDAIRAGADRTVMQGYVNYTVWLNRSFAMVHGALFSAAIVLWSLGWPRGGGWRVALARVAGLAVGVGLLGWLASGTMTLEARQGALSITVLQCGWAILAALALWPVQNRTLSASAPKS